MILCVREKEREREEEEKREGTSAHFDFVWKAEYNIQNVLQRLQLKV